MPVAISLSIAIGLTTSVPGILTVDQRHRSIDPGDPEWLAGQQLREIEVTRKDARHCLTRAVVPGEHHLVLHASGLKSPERTHCHVIAEGVHAVKIWVGG